MLSVTWLDHEPHGEGIHSKPNGAREAMCYSHGSLESRTSGACIAFITCHHASQIRLRCSASTPNTSNARATTEIRNIDSRVPDMDNMGLFDAEMAALEGRPVPPPAPEDYENLRRNACTVCDG